MAASKAKKTAAKGEAATPPSPLDVLGIDEVCDRLVGGESQTAIAQSAGVHVATLCRWLAADPQRSARAREARLASAASFADLAAQKLEDARDPFELAKARELASHFRWKASKANPREYGEKLEIDQKTTVTDLTEEQLDAKLARLLEAGRET
ncbi:hypothetical protein ABIC89_001052 [Variovorax boronicumulans]|uniref:terminase small subunit-like protein n=1 Tax=Variovorax boronicumulans TaxID=436515 RepID=UPI0033989851